MKDWLSIACEKSIVNRAIRVSLIVGSILALINHLDAILVGDLNTIRLMKIILTYLVPYAVSTYSSVAAVRSAAGH